MQRNIAAPLPFEAFLASSVEVKKIKELVKGLMVTTKDSGFLVGPSQTLAAFENAKNYDDLFNAILPPAIDQIHGTAQEFSTIMSMALVFAPKEMRDSFSIMQKVIEQMVTLYHQILPLTSYVEKEAVITFLNKSNAAKKVTEFAKKEFYNTERTWEDPIREIINNNYIHCLDMQKAVTFKSAVELAEKIDFSYCQPSNGLFSMFATSPSLHLTAFKKEIKEKMQQLGYDYQSPKKTLTCS